MNKHFHDARYYLGRASEHVTLGVSEELEGLEVAVRERTGYGEEPEPTTMERVREVVDEPDRLLDHARTTATDVADAARESVAEYRTGRDQAS